MAEILTCHGQREDLSSSGFDERAWYTSIHANHKYSQGISRLIDESGRQELGAEGGRDHWTEL